MQEACRAMGDKHNRGNVMCLDFPVDARQLATGMPSFYGVREADLPQVRERSVQLPLSSRACCRPLFHACKPLLCSVFSR